MNATYITQYTDVYRVKNELVNQLWPERVDFKRCKKRRRCIGALWKVEGLKSRDKPDMN